MISKWPQLGSVELARCEDAEVKFGALQEVVNAVRSARAEYKVEPGKKIGADILVSDAEMLKSLSEEQDVLAYIARIDEANLNLGTFEDYVAGDSKSVKLVVREGVEVILPLDQLVDVEKEKLRLGKQAEKVQKDIDLLEKRLNSKGFVDKAPAAKIQETKDQLSDKQAQLASIIKTVQEL
mmetsp:Transcript_21541/g.38200  ORF Transcript_21541/g.38200 Transcript_21541/m.38200 type:complete len:181 (+) Transcript_21541:1-543(+)